MENTGLESSGFNQKFETPEAEINFLREKIKEKESLLNSQNKNENQNENVRQAAVVKDVVEEYSKEKKEHVLHENMQVSREVEDQIVLSLSPEPHDSKVGQLLGILRKNGLKNTLSILDKMHDPHLEDDFHRFLVEYFSEGYHVTGLKEKGPEFRALNMALFEITISLEDEEEKKKTLKELISSMEQFYAGMLSLESKSEVENNYFTIELAMPALGEEVSFFASVPISSSELFEKHVLSIFHNAKVMRKHDDYNIFNEQGAYVASYATAGGKPILPIKTYEEFDYDPLNVLLNSFSKIDKAGEGAAIQLIIKPAKDKYIKEYSHVLKKVEKGESLKKALTGEGFSFFMKSAMKEVFSAPKSAEQLEKDKQKKESKKPDENTVELIRKKISAPILETNIRIIASSRSEAEAEAILSDIESAFNQFENTVGNKINFTQAKKHELHNLGREFIYRSFSSEQNIPLNIHEVTTLVHFHTTALKGQSQLKQSKSNVLPSPASLPTDGTLLGVNNYRGQTKEIFLSPEDRLRHMYVIGQTGTGKSTLLKNMIIEDIIRGDGVCMIDPHGVDILDVLANVPKERYEDVIYFDPSHTARPMALNMLEYDQRFPEQKTFVVNELFSIFQKLYSGSPESMGPMFEQYFRNATMLVIEDPETGCTLLDVSRVLADKAFRQLKISKCKNPIVVQFWTEVAEKAGGEASLANIVPYITSKFDIFLANDYMRPIIAQEKSSFNFREIMDSKKILLVNLAKGRLGDINANLIGLIIVGKILMATLSRVDMFGKDFPPFYFYIDEFQNVTTNSISTILSEARKYKLSLNIAHQFIAQLEEGISDSVFGNVGNMVSFRVGSDDGEFLEKQFAPDVTALDLMNVDNRNAYIKMLVNGRPTTPFSLETLPPRKGRPENIENLKKLSHLKYGKDLAEVEEYIMSKYKKSDSSLNLKI
jgi:hypothetical protein